MQTRTDAKRMLLEQRAQTRFEVNAEVTVVAVQNRTGHIQPQLFQGTALNVSASGALIAFDGPLDFERVWLRLADGDRSLSECIVVRHECREETPYCYGVQFACVWTDTTLTQLLDSIR